MGLFSAYLDFKEIFPWKGRFPKLSRKRFEIKLFFKLQYAKDNFVSESYS